MPVKIVENIFAILMTVLVFVTLLEYTWHPLSRQSFFADVLLVLIVGYIFSIILPLYAAESGEIDAEYYFIRLRSAEAKVNAEETIESFQLFCFSVISSQLIGFFTSLAGLSTGNVGPGNVSTRNGSCMEHIALRYLKVVLRIL